MTRNRVVAALALLGLIGVGLTLLAAAGQPTGKPSDPAKPPLPAHKGRIGDESSIKSARLVDENASSTCRSASSSLRCREHSRTPCAFKSSGQLAIRSIGSTACTTS